MATISLSNLKGGESLDKIPVSIKNLKKSGDRYYFTVSDKSGNLDAYCSVKLYSYEQIRNFSKCPVLISGLAEAKLNALPVVKVKQFSSAPVTDELLEQTTEMIDAQHIDFYLQNIQKYKNAVKNPAYCQLLDAFFSEEHLKMLQTMPATHTRQANLYGGLLQETAVVTALSVNNANLYLRYANGIYSFAETYQIDYDLLITGALLHLSGNLLYFSEKIPHHKTSLGVNQGFINCTTNLIHNFIREYGIVISDEDLAALFSVVCQCDEHNKSVKANCLEAKILKGAFYTFKSLDMFERSVVKAIETVGLSDEEEQDELNEYMYNSELNCYASNSYIQKKGAILEKYGHSIDRNKK